MPRRILIVKSETYSFSKLKHLLSGYTGAYDFTFVENRQEAQAELKKTSFDKVITALKVPRLSDGYLFIAQITDKYFASDSIIVIVDEKTENLTTSLKSRGVVHIYSAANLVNAVNVLVQGNNQTSPESGSVPNIPADVEYDLEKVKTVLNYVMGPVGNMIFNDVVGRWQDHDDFNELLNLIRIEIKDEDRIELFQDKLS